jgi:uncharacterized protein YjeT (DUF2065 family)
MYFSLLLITIGIVQLVKPDLMEKLIRAKNKRQGVKTNITQQTKQYYKMLGSLSIIVGIILLFAP